MINTVQYRNGPMGGPGATSRSNTTQPTVKHPLGQWRTYDADLADDPLAVSSLVHPTVGQMSNGQAIVRLQGVKARHAVDLPLVLDIDNLTFCPGERVALIGPSGAGKTTLLRLLNGYIRPECGHLDVLGNKIDAAIGRGRHYREFWPRDVRRRIGFVFQDFSLVERASVFQNVLWGRLGRANPLWSLLGRFSKADKEAAMAAIAEVDLLTQTTQRVDTLSGGQQQRVGVARVLAQEAEVILADEPVSNLDPALADDVLDLLAQVSRRRNAALVMSLHQPVLAQKYADRIIGLNQGRIVYDGPANTFDRQALQRIYQRSGERLHKGAVGSDVGIDLLSATPTRLTSTHATELTPCLH